MCVFCKHWNAPHCKYHLIESVPAVDGYLDMHQLDCGLFEIEYITPEEYHARTGNKYPDEGVVKYFVSYDNWKTSYSYVHTYKNAKKVSWGRPPNVPIFLRLW